MASARLTNAMRDAFVRGIMADVPRIDFEEQARALIMKDNIAHLPPKVRAVAEDKTLRHHLTTSTYYLPRPNKGLSSGYTVYAGRCDISWNPSSEISAELAAIQLAARSAQELHESLRDRVRSVAYACTTRAALAKALPEFAKYLPAEIPPPSRSLPAIANVVADFVKAGWPKGKRA